MKASDLDLVRLALSRGWISPEWHDRALTEADRLQALGLEKSADDVLVDEGVLSSRQVRRLRDELGWTPARPRIGGYEVLRRIGLGGMGTVFEARHVRLRQRIALKILLPQYARDPVLTGRFLQEGRALARLNHPHLVHALDAGQDGEYYYLAMEYVEGEDLRQLLGREKRVDPRRSVEIVSGVCQALEVLEGRGLVHRDIKPANILIDKHGVVKLADLGLLRVTEAPGPRGDRFVCGTPQYVSPEQAFHHEDIDIRSDLYALAATWYHLLVGRPPFVGRSSGEVLRAHREKAPPPPSALRPDVPRPVERVILRWLSKDRQERPQSAAEALDELRALGKRLEWPREILSRVLRPVRGVYGTRRKLGIGLTVAGLVVLTILLVALRRERQADDTESPAGARDVASLGKADDLEEPAEKVYVPHLGKRSPQERSPNLLRPGGADDASPPLPLPGALPPSEVVPAIPDSSLPGSVFPDAVFPDAVLPDAALPDQGSSGQSPSLLAELRGRADDLAALREKAGLLWESLLRVDRRFDEVRPLAASFHASSVVFEPGGDLQRDILLRYEFREAPELDDFRARPGAWMVLDGRLASLAGGVGEWLDTVAWFTPPIRVRGELEAEARLTIALGSLRVAPGGAAGGLEAAGRVWREEAGGDVEHAAVPFTGEGPFSVSFLGDSVEFIGGGRRGKSAVDGLETGPEAGRVRIRVGEGQALLWLVIEGRLESTWASERLRLLRE